MADLLLTLGHNSSAIVAEENGALIGYETERITKKKSDSSFPSPVIDRLADFEFEKFDKVYVTHWDPSNRVDFMSEKHYNGALTRSLCGGKVISQEDVGLTHHDTHAYAAVAFAGPNFPSTKDDHTMVLVVDGFGNFAEHVSVYSLIDGVLSPKHRIFGYFTSIGLMYQYATAFLGMKMHEDEYKLLGYQSKLPGMISEYQAQSLHEFTMKHHKIWRRSVEMKSDGPSLSFSLDVLPDVKIHWSGIFQQLLNTLSISDQKGLHARIVIAHFVQSLTEMNIEYIVRMYNPKNLIVSGGVFMNVGLNAMLVKMIPNLFCANPLSGDQGNAIGLRYAVEGRYSYSDLRIGKRKSLSTYGNLDLPENFIIVDSSEEMARIAMAELDDLGYVNIVRGDMEFGPRALCNTSTLAIPDMTNVIDINMINGRNTVMPFAPVMNAQAYSNHFESAGKVWRSEQYMITALECGPEWKYPGASLVTHTGAVTARPQVISHNDPVMKPLLDKHQVLINTSFNVHGVPIVLDVEDAIKSHSFQASKGSPVKTIYLDQ